MLYKSLVFFLVLFFIPSLSFSSSILDDQDTPLETLPSLQNLIGLNQAWGLDLGAVYKRQSLLRSRDDITNGDVSADIMNLLALKDHYAKREAEEQFVADLEELTNKIALKIKGYKKDLKKKSNFPVDLRSSMVELKRIQAEKLTLLESKRGQLSRSLSSTHLLEIISETQNAVLSHLSSYGVTLQHLKALPSKSDFAKL